MTTTQTVEQVEVKHRRKWLSISSERFMDIQIKTFLGLQRGNHVIAIIGGAVAVQGLNQIFNKVIDETRQLLDCKILIDFQDSILKILPLDIRTCREH
jgi:hypothetical protein